MGASIVLPGLASNDPVPGIYMHVAFAQGPSSGSGLLRGILVIANRSTAGTATAGTVIYGPDTITPLQTEDDMISLGGPGSEAHRMFRRMTAVNKDTPIYWLFVTPSAGTAASGTFVLTNAATGSGVHQCWIGDELTETSISLGDAVDTIGANIVLQINAKTHLPVTAAYDAPTDTVTLTAKIAGPRGNWIRFMCRVTPGIATTTGATTDGFLTLGATADSNTTALGTILARYFYYQVSAAEDVSQFGAHAGQILTQSGPTTGLRQRCFAGSVDTLANAITVATTINNPRAEVVWHEKSPWTPAELAANAAAVYALGESDENNPETSFVEYGNDTESLPYWKVPKSRVDSAAPTRASIKSALNNGISPIAVNPNGTTYLVNRITSRSLSGSTADYRIRGAHKVTICDFFGDALRTKIKLQTARTRIGSDVPKGQREPGPRVTTEKTLRGIIFGLINQYDLNDLLQNVPNVKAGTVVQRETNPSTRHSMYIPLETIDNFEQGAVFVAQVA